MDISTVQDIFSFLTPEYISTLTPAQKATYTAQVQSTISNLETELLSDAPILQQASTLVSTDTGLIDENVSTVNAALADLDVANSAYELASTLVVSTQAVYDDVSTINANNELQRVALNTEISTLTAQYISASTFIGSVGAEDKSTLMGLSSQQAIYSESISSFFSASTNTFISTQTYLTYSTFYASTVAVSNVLSSIVQSTTASYDTATSTVNGYKDEYVQLNIDYLNKNTAAIKADSDFTAASLALSSAVLYQTLSHLNADNLTLDSQLKSTTALVPVTGSLTAQQLMYQAMGLTLQEKLTSTIQALSSIGMQASSLSIQAKEAAVAAAGISVDLYTSSVNNYSSLAAASAANISSILSTQVSYLRLATVYDAQALSTQKGLPAINLLTVQAISSIDSYTERITIERSAVLAARLRYTQQTQLASTLTQSTLFYASTITGYSTLIHNVDVDAYTSKKAAADKAVETISTQIVSTQKGYAVNDEVYKFKSEVQEKSNATAKLYNSLYIVSNTQVQEGEYKYKGAQARLYRIPADSTFIGYKSLSDTSAQQVSTGALQTNPYGTQLSTSRSTLVAWNVSVNLFDNVLHLISSYTPACQTYYRSVSTHVSSVKGFYDVNTSARLDASLGPQVSSAAIYMSTTLTEQLDIQQTMQDQQKMVSTAMLLADSSWDGLMLPLSVSQIYLTVDSLRG